MIDAPLQIDLPASPGETRGKRCVVGPENELLVPVLAQLLGDDPLSDAARAFNPLVLTGPSGTGKTLLAQAIARRFGQRYGVEQTHYFTAPDFCRELQNAGSEGRSSETLERLRGAAILIVEELDRLRPRHPGQWVLRSLVDDLTAAGRCVVITARQPLASLPQLEPGLRDRLTEGLTIGLNWPGEAARKLLLAEEAVRRGLPLSAADIERLARKHDGPATKILGALARLAAPASDGASLSDDVAPADEGPSLKQIAAVVGRYCGVTQASLASPSRRQSLVHARCLVAYLARRLTSHSYAEIGRCLGDRDHTTIIHAESRIQELLAHDAATAEAVDELTRILQAR